CRNSTDTHTRTMSTLTPLASSTQTGGPALVWKETSALLQTTYSAPSCAAVPTPIDGDRVATSTYVFAANGPDYRLLPQTATKSQQVGGTLGLYAQATHTFDS